MGENNYKRTNAKIKKKYVLIITMSIHVYIEYFQNQGSNPFYTLVTSLSDYMTHTFYPHILYIVRGGLKHFHKERGPIFFREKKSYFETICFKKNKIILRFN